MLSHASFLKNYDCLFFDMWHLIHKQIIRNHIGNILFNSCYHNMSTWRE